MMQYQPEGSSGQRVADKPNHGSKEEAREERCGPEPSPVE